MSIYLDTLDWQFESTNKIATQYLPENKSINIYKQMVTIDDGFQLARQEIATDIPLICPAVSNHQDYIGVCFHLAKNKVDSSKLAYPHLFCNQLNVTNGYQYDDTVHALSEPTYYVSLRFHRSYLNDLHTQHGLPSWLMNFVDGESGMLDKITVPEEMIRLAWKICQLPRNMNLTNQLKMQSLALTWLAKLVEHQPEQILTTETFSASSYLIAKQACDVIHLHFSQPLTIKGIAKAIGTNECYLKKAFRENMGLSIHQYLTKIRLEKARYLLYHNQQLGINHIATLCGYQPNNFSQVFKKHADMTPSEYKKNGKFGS